MKRSETVLVYAVTAVLAVILLVAVVFGGDPEPVERDRSAQLEELMYGPESDGVEGGEEIEGGEAGGSEVGGPTSNGSAEGGDPESTIPALRVPRGAAQLRALLGPFEIDEGYEGDVYRRITVRQGDTFDQLLYDWTGSAAMRVDTLALNEDLDIDNLSEGQAVLFPWVEASILLQRLEDRGRVRELRGVGGAGVRTPTAASQPATAREASMDSRERSMSAPAEQPESLPTTAGESAGEIYVVKQGESLWAIAERKVGANQATGYINQILAANSSIKDPSKVGEGLKIVLP